MFIVLNRTVLNETRVNELINLINHFFNGEKLYKKAVSSVCEKYGLTYTEFNVLIFLSNNPQFDTATQIVEVRHLAKSHVSISLRSLTEKGLIESEFRGENHRTVHLKVSENAGKIIKDAKKAQEDFWSKVTEGFTDGELKMLENFNLRIDGNIKKYL